MSVEQTARKLPPDPDAGETNSSGPQEVLRTQPTNMSGNNTQLESTEQPTAGTAQKEETHMDDFAAALESYTLETEPAPSEDNVFKGTVIKITPTHVVVDIGFKSEGLVPIAVAVRPGRILSRFHIRGVVPSGATF
jgi:hypothetical protein